MITDYITEKTESTDTTENYKCIYKFLKAHNFLVSKNDTYIPNHYIEYHPIFLDLIPILLHNIAEPLSITESEMSFKTLICYCESTDSLELINENHDILKEIVLRSLSQGLTDMESLNFVFRRVSKTLDDYSIYVDIGFEVFDPFVLERDLLPENRWIPHFLLELSRVYQESEYQVFILMILEKQPTTIYYREFIQILLNFFQSPKYDESVYFDFFHHSQESCQIDGNFFWYPFKCNVISHSWCEFSLLYSTMLVHNSDYAQFLPIEPIVRSVHSILNSDEYENRKIGKEITYFRLIGVILSMKIFPNNILDEICYNIYQLIMKHLINFNSLNKEYILSFLPFLLEYIKVDSLREEEFETILQFFNDTITTQQDGRRINQICGLLLRYKDIIEMENLFDFHQLLKESGILDSIEEFVDEIAEEEHCQFSLIESFLEVFRSTETRD